MHAFMPKDAAVIFDVVTPPSTLAKTIVEALQPHIDPYFQLNRDWKDQIAAIIERCFSGGDNEQRAAGAELKDLRSECCDASVVWTADGPVCTQCNKWAVTKG